LPDVKLLAVFIGVCVVSVVYAVGFADVPLNGALNELRPVAFYGVSILTALAITRTSQLNTLLVGMFILADVIVGAIVLQQFAGAGRLLLPGMDDWQVVQVDLTGTTDLESSTTVAGIGGVRIVPPAHVLLFLVMVLAFIRMVAPHVRPAVRAVYAAEFVFINGGLLLTYTRGQWIASIVSLVLACLLLPRAAQVRIAQGLLAAGGVVAFGVLLFAAGLEPPGNVGTYGGALVSRALSAFNLDQTLASPSLQWRAFETEQALNALLEAPQGVGLGSAYRPVTTFAGEAAGYQGPEPLNRFVHNSYLYIAVKTGVLGLGVFLWFCVAFIARSGRLLRRTPETSERWLVLAVLATFVGVMQWSITEANFMQTGSTAVVGLMVGIVMSVSRTSGCVTTQSR
jgi:O-antigen ligase